MNRLRYPLAATAGSAIGLGIALALAKGQNAGARNAFGNLSAPWILLPFLVGATQRSVIRGAGAGVVAVLAAFLGFYAAEAFVLDLGTSDLMMRLRLTLGSGHIYEVLGLPAGALFGALGALWRLRPWPLAPLVPAGVFVIEPLLVRLLAAAGLWADDGLRAYSWIYLGEALAGIAASALVVRRRQLR